MAAIDPTAEVEDGPARATLKLIRIQDDDDDDEEDDDDFDPDNIEELRAKLLADGVLGSEDESDDSEDSEDETNGGPSDPAKSKQAKREALQKKLQEDAAAEEMEIDQLTNGVNGTKGKGKALEDDDESDESDDDEEGDEAEELVLCTLDPEKVTFLCRIHSESSLTILAALPANSGDHRP